MKIVDLQLIALCDQNVHPIWKPHAEHSPFISSLKSLQRPREVAALEFEAVNGKPKSYSCSEFQNKTGTHPRFSVSSRDSKDQRVHCNQHYFQSDTFGIEDLDQCVKNRQVLYQFPGGHFSNGFSALQTNMTFDICVNLC